MTIDRSRPASYQSQRSFRSSSGSQYEYEKPLGEKIKDCCRFTISFIFTNVGICGLMVGYTIMGAQLFRYIEYDKKQRAELPCFQIDSERDKIVKKLWNITLDHNTFHNLNWSSRVMQEVEYYEKIMVKNIRLGYDGNDTEFGPELQWEHFEQGFLYSLTVITTIGYGHITPSKMEGKIATIFYTIFGMPVFLLYMANMGDILAKSLKWIYAKVFICKKNTPQYDAQVAWRSADTMLRGHASPPIIPDSYPKGRRGAIFGIPPYEEEEEEDEEEEAEGFDYDLKKIPSVSGALEEAAIYTRSHYKDRPKNQHDPRSYNRHDDFEIDNGRMRHEYREDNYNTRKGRNNYNYNNINDNYNSRRRQDCDYTDHRHYNSMDDLANTYDRNWRKETRHSRSSRDYFEDEYESSITNSSELVSLEMAHTKPEKLDLASVNIPISVSLLIMAMLLTGGMVLFKSYEGDSWGYVTSFYFCFISLTTIGFGDYVPGNSLRGNEKHGFIYVSLYLMVGLALLSMCFNLMQEEIVQTVTKCLKSIRMIKEKETE